MTVQVPRETNHYNLVCPDCKKVCHVKCKTETWKNSSLVDLIKFTCDEINWHGKCKKCGCGSGKHKHLKLEYQAEEQENETFKLLKQIVVDSNQFISEQTIKLATFFETFSYKEKVDQLDEELSNVKKDLKSAIAEAERLCLGPSFIQQIKNQLEYSELILQNSDISMAEREKLQREQENNKKVI